MTINCSDGAEDHLVGGSGSVDYIVGGALNDLINGEDGMDLVFGDHARIELYPTSHKLKYAETIEPGCTGGEDDITLGPGDDMVRPLSGQEQ